MIKRHDIRPRRKRGTVVGVERASDQDSGSEDFDGERVTTADER